MSKGILPTCFLPLPAPAGLSGSEHLHRVSYYEVWNTFIILAASGTTTGPYTQEGSPEILELIPELVLDSVLEPLLHNRNVIQLWPPNTINSSLVNLHAEEKVSLNFFFKVSLKARYPTGSYGIKNIAQLQYLFPNKSTGSLHKVTALMDVTELGIAAS